MKKIKEIVVLSGKGGTGKTSVAASFALIAGKDAIIADCDVDAANMHLVLKPNFAHSQVYCGGDVAVLNQDSCTLCGKCKEVCRFGAVDFSNGRYTIKDLDCEGCGYCSHVCPSGAITMVERKSGDLFISHIKNGSQMVHAKLSPGAENSGKLVAQVKTNAGRIAGEVGCEYVIADGAPGIGCPVASSLSGASLAVMVTEPTKSALHDLKRVLTVAKRFNVRPLCIINKYNINSDQTAVIKEFIEKEGITHLADIPFDSSFVKAMGQAKSIIEVDSKMKALLEETWGKVKEIAQTV
ncbi:MAG: ATP-binding protein [Bacteroidales bacterium]|nr:ATP-binding protein [Bacteroidales bacterium]